MFCLNMTSTVIQTPSEKINSFLQDVQYYSLMVNSANFNVRLIRDRKTRLPFLDSQTGIAQSPCKLFVKASHRLPGIRTGQLYVYPAHRWCRRKRSYITLAEQAAKDVEICENQTSIENTMPLMPTEELPPPVEQKVESFYYDESSFLEEEEDEPDNDDDDTYNARNSRKKKKIPKPKPATKSGRGRKKREPVNYKIITDADDEHPDKPYECSLCGARYKTRQGLSYHLSHTHKGGNNGTNTTSSTTTSTAKSTHSNQTDSSLVTTQNYFHQDQDQAPCIQQHIQTGIHYQQSNIQAQQFHPTQQPILQMPQKQELPYSQQPPHFNQQVQPFQKQYQLQQQVAQEQNLQTSLNQQPLPQFTPTKLTPQIKPQTKTQQENVPNFTQFQDNFLGFLASSHENPPPSADGECEGSAKRNPSDEFMEASSFNQVQNEAESSQVPSSTALQVGGPPPKGANRRDQDGRAPPNNYCDFCLGNETYNKAGEAEELISCADCGRSGHPTCLQFTPNMILSVHQYRWQCLECKSCTLCGTSENDDKLLFCDDCDRGYHLYCLEPPLSEPPEGEWSCELCQQNFHKPPLNT